MTSTTSTARDQTMIGGKSQQGGQGETLRAGVQLLINGVRHVWLLVLLLLLWQLIVSLKLYPAFLLPSPVAVVKSLIGTAESGYLTNNVMVSLNRQMIGFVLSVAFALPVGIFLGYSPRFRQPMLPILQLLYPIPGLAWVPLAILWLGIGNAPIIFVIFFSSIWPLLFNTQAGIANINPIYRRAAMALGTSPLRTFTRVIIPAALPFIVAGLRLTYGTSWRVIVGAEILSSHSGLGFMIDNARGLLRGDEVIAGMITIAVLGYLFEKIAFDILEHYTIKKWGMSL